MTARPPAYVSIGTLARELDLSETTVREKVKRGELPQPRRSIGNSPRWKWADIESWMDGGKGGTLDAAPKSAIEEAAANAR